MKTDRELTELAAKAAGYVCEWHEAGYMHMLRGAHEESNEGMKFWNPLADDGDALRLGTSLMLDIRHTDDEVAVLGYNGQWQHEPVYNDRPEATRRAIVRAAATYGKAMR